ncbi:type II TA system antitoxin MqsA family protein [Agitococcus lubricus]|uniref:HTH-type transcriptional regulator/antitoxin MqsA n=1 Tax=Agitococcus lubricus TaxID=1077255 RepID=A0A2T5ITP7_9GAMM|nr:type II TA system antitoxin MqsA family protein [Agitococcus lubricus]PTQ87188.1 HTH-type transcriptional regulator/antitoxin MqsA [Agitococcus lubricus]
MSKLCVSCGSDHMQHESRNLTFTYKDQHVVVEAVEGCYCPDCGAAYLEDNGRYAESCATLVRHTTVAEAALIRETRKKLGLTQREAGELFGGGVSAFSEYERGKTQPHKATLLLLRLLNAHPESVRCKG